MYFSVDKRHWPYKRHWPEFGVVTILWIGGTGLIWVKMHWPDWG